MSKLSIFILATLLSLQQGQCGFLRSAATYSAAFEAPAPILFTRTPLARYTAYAATPVGTLRPAYSRPSFAAPFASISVPLPVSAPLPVAPLAPAPVAASAPLPILRYATSYSAPYPIPKFYETAPLADCLPSYDAPAVFSAPPPSSVINYAAAPPPSSVVNYATAPWSTW